MPKFGMGFPRTAAIILVTALATGTLAGCEPDEVGKIENRTRWSIIVLVATKEDGTEVGPQKTASVFRSPTGGCFTAEDIVIQTVPGFTKVQIEVRVNTSCQSRASDPRPPPTQSEQSHTERDVVRALSNLPIRASAVR